ncbi:MAG: YkgJ family cysteine cluster protein [Bacteroidia bacterium]|nr:YkgJ family cysteine cluster protein [Bacteroidia bacterium]
MSSIDHIEEWRKRKQEAKASHKKLLKRLSKAKDKPMNERAESLHQEAFSKIDCLDCANCCKSIPPLLNDTDARRIARHLGMKEARFKDEYVTIDEDGDMVMNASPCPFLGENNYCDIYEVRPKACREYPHTDDYQFAGLKHLHATNAQYCPAVFYILEEMQKGL